MDTVFRPLQTRQSSTPPGTFTLDSEPPSPRPVCSHLRALCVKGSSAPTPSIRCQLSTVDCQPSSLGHLLLNRPFDLTQKSLDKLYTYMILYAMLARQITLPRPFPTKLTPLLRYSCRLFVVLKKVNPFGIKQIRTLLAKYRGWGYPRTPRFQNQPPAPSSLHQLHALCVSATRHSSLATRHFLLSPFRINTFRTVTKQTTLTLFRITTYEKPRGRGASHRPHLFFSRKRRERTARAQDWYRMRGYL